MLASEISTAPLGGSMVSTTVWGPKKVAIQMLSKKLSKLKSRAIKETKLKNIVTKLSPA